MSSNQTHTTVRRTFKTKNCSESEEEISGDATNNSSKQLNFTTKNNDEPIQSLISKKISCKPINAESCSISYSDNDADELMGTMGIRPKEYTGNKNDERREKRLPVELQYRRKQRKHADNELPVVSLKVQLQNDQYLRSLYEELESLKCLTKRCSRSERMYKLRAKQNEILFYRNQFKVADYYNGRVVKSNGPDFILLPGTTIPRKLPEGFIFGMQGTADEDGQRDIILIQSIKDFNGL